MMLGSIKPDVFFQVLTSLIDELHTYVEVTQPLTDSEHSGHPTWPMYVALNKK